MPEQYNAQRELDNSTHFNHLLLESELQRMMGHEDFDGSDLTVRLEINGQEVRIGDFNKVLEDWGDRVFAELKRKLDFLKTEEAVNARAEEMVRERLGKAHDFLQDIENNIWKLEE